MAGMVFRSVGAVVLAACTLAAGALAQPVASSQVRPLEQGAAWTDTARAAFYAQDQGSRLMKFSWFKALQQADGRAFAADGLARFGYLRNNGDPANLPVGFTLGTWNDATYVGLTCAACHTRQIEVGGVQFRVDGGPAIADLQGLFAELDAATQRVLASDATFTAFAADVLGPDASSTETGALRNEVVAWAGPYHALMANALPEQPWGIGRADAVGMILNRIGGLDIGTSPDRITLSNIRRATAPVRYPFLWNAPVQNRTQWPGFAENGTDLLALMRNLGEVYGVFAVFKPERQRAFVGGIDYISTNSANFAGLEIAEQLVKRIGQPKWPWPIDAALAEQGKALYARNDGGGSCESCHGIRELTTPPPTTWNTPLVDVGTDTREYDILTWRGDSGVLAGATLPMIPPIEPTDFLLNVLKVSTGGAILQQAGTVHPDMASPPPVLAAVTPASSPEIARAVNVPVVPQLPYEARVLKGIWAAAPYLHNGSVPTLADLLEPAERRPVQFEVGAVYDIEKVGLAVTQPGLHSTVETTGCGTGRGSGNSRCGHEFGTTWNPDEKKALLEYLKTL